MRIFIKSGFNTPTLFVAAIVLSGAYCSQIAASDSTETKQDADNVSTLPKMTVTATRLQAIIENPQSEAPSLQPALSIVTEDDMRRRNAETVVDAVMYLPGSWVETRGRKVKQFVSFRGQHYPYPDYAVDGVWQQEFDELPYFIATNDIERIEVMRSSAALINGVSGLSGIINIIPKAYDSTVARAAVEYGTFNSLRISAGHGQTTRRIAYAAGAGFSKTDGPLNRNAAEQAINLYGRCVAQLNSSVTLQTNIFGLYGKRELALIQYPGDTSNANLSSRQRFGPHRALIANSRLLWKQSEKSSFAGIAYYTRRNHDFYSSVDSPHPSSNDLDWEWGAHITQAFSLVDKNILRIGALYNNWAAPFGKRFYSGKPALVHTLSAVIADEHSFGELAVDGGVRWLKKYYDEWAAYNIEGTNVWKKKKVEISLEPVTDQWEPSQIHGACGATFSFPAFVKLFAHGAFGQVEPKPGSVCEDLSQPDNERQAKLDGGLRIAHDKIGSLQTTGFSTMRFDGIAITKDTTAHDGRIYPIYDNVDMRTGGIEIEAKSAALFGMIAASANAAWMKHVKKQAGSFVEDREIPALIVNGGLSFALKGFETSLFGKFVGSYENDRFSYDKQPHALGDYGMLGTAVRYNLKLKSRHLLKLYVNMDNILDERYSTVVGYPDFGRAISGGIEYAF